MTNAPPDQARFARDYPQFFQTDWRQRGLLLAWLVPAIFLFFFGFYWLDISWSRVGLGLGRLGEFTRLMFPPTYVQSLAETLAIAFLGTLIAALFALPFGFLAAKNVMSNPVLHFLARRFLDMIRTVDTLVWALIWINVVGLGPFAGILAIATSNFGLFGKLYSEAIETADTRPVEGILSTGGSHLHGVRFGLLPQILPVMVSQILYQFESNTRSATIIGIVGAGGIGQHLYEQIKILEWQHVSFLVLLVLLAVMCIDFLSVRIRFAIIGSAQGNQNA